MEIKEAYIDRIICHQFSLDPTRCLLNSTELSLSGLDVSTLKKIFTLPFERQRVEYTFSHAVDLSYNVVYNSALKIMQNEDFIKCSQDIFRHLCAVSTNPTIKDGDIFIAKIEDVKIEDSFYEGIGIFKIETKSKFVETYVDDSGTMKFDIKSGFQINKIDKACLVVLTDKFPICYIVDNSKDAKFWRDEFLNLVPLSNNYLMSKSTMAVLQDFIKLDLPSGKIKHKDEQIQLVNKCTELLKSTNETTIEKVVDELFEDKEMVDAFYEYKKIYEEREQLRLDGQFMVDKKAISSSKSVKRIKLDDTSEIYLLKTGRFIERGYDEDKGMRYYKLYFNEEK